MTYLGSLFTDLFIERPLHARHRAFQIFRQISPHQLSGSWEKQKYRLGRGQLDTVGRVLEGWTRENYHLHNLQSGFLQTLLLLFIRILGPGIIVSISQVRKLRGSEKTKPSGEWAISSDSTKPSCLLQEAEFEPRLLALRSGVFSFTQLSLLISLLTVLFSVFTSVEHMENHSAFIQSVSSEHLLCVWLDARQGWPRPSGDQRGCGNAKVNWEQRRGNYWSFQV